jgi:hypothetical protein
VCFDLRPILQCELTAMSTSSSQNGETVTANVSATSRISESLSAQSLTTQDREPAADAEAETAGSSRVKQAEEMTSRLAEKTAAVASSCVTGLAWFFTRVRESAEDVWADAQSIRRKDPPADAPPRNEQK